mgnify:CR=1 FL=1
MRFRPCIDLHAGTVKQIVGSTLGDDPSKLRTNFESTRSAAEFANMYRRDNLVGGHVIMLGPGNEDAALSALAAYPGGLQVGGGVTGASARKYLDAGASHVIVTSWVFVDGKLSRERLAELVGAVGAREWRAPAPLSPPLVPCGLFDQRARAVACRHAGSCSRGMRGERSVGGAARLAAPPRGAHVGLRARARARLRIHQSSALLPCDGAVGSEFVRATPAVAWRTGRERIVLDLSCRKHPDDPCGPYHVVMDKWQRFTDCTVTRELLAELAASCDEFLVHGVDVEGKGCGIEDELVRQLGEWSPLPVTYAGGCRDLEDIERVRELGGGRVDVTIGSALDIFGGALPYADVVQWDKREVIRSSPRPACTP